MRTPEEVINIVKLIQKDIRDKGRNSIYYDNLFAVSNGNVIFKDSFLAKSNLQNYVDYVVFRSLKERRNYYVQLRDRKPRWSLLPDNFTKELDSTSIPSDLVALNFGFDEERFKSQNMNENRLFIKALLRESLEEAEKSEHLRSDSYPSRILHSTFKDMDPKHKVEVDKRLADIEGLEFSSKKQQKIGIWVYKAPEFVHHEPWTPRDKGNLLLLIVNNNNMSTLYWKHQREGQYDYEIKYEDLMEFVNSEYYDPKNKPVTIANIIKWKNSKNAPPKKDKFTKETLTNGNKIRYYSSGKIETLEGKPLKAEDVFDYLPEPLQMDLLDKLNQ